MLTPHCAIITRPGATSRRGETEEIERVLGTYFSEMETIKEPGCLDGGDVMMVGIHFYTGLSEKTNYSGAAQAIEILERYGLSGSVVRLEKVLHLKTGLAYLENNHLVMSGEFLHKPEFRSFQVLEIDTDESYAANCVWINGTVLVAAGYPKAKKTIKESDCPLIELDVSEFRKLDGDLSCLSLRF